MVVTLRRLALKDSKPDSSHSKDRHNEATLSGVIAPIVKQLRHGRNAVVVHCRTGQISASLIASILILAGGMTLHEAASLLESDKNWQGGCRFHVGPPRLSRP